MNLKSIGLMVFFFIVLACVVQAATNNYTITRTSTSDLSNGAWYNGFTIGSDKISLSSSEGQYTSAAFNVPNSTIFGMNTSGYSPTTDTLNYGLVYGNSIWLNSTDGRHLTGGHAAYSDRWTMTSPVATKLATTKDSWFTSSADSDNLVMYNDAQIIAGTAPCGNYMSFDGTNDYAQATLLTLPIKGVWTIAFSYFSVPTGSTTQQLYLYNASSTSDIIGIGDYFASGTSYYRRVFIRDVSGHIYYARNTSRYITLNTWHNCVVTCDGTTVKIFDDGVMAGSVSISGLNSNARFNTIRLGCTDSLGSDFSGRLDDVSIMHGQLPDAYCANVTAFTTPMWNNLRSIGNTPTPPYRVNSAYDTGNQYMSIYGTGTFDITDYSDTISNTKPNIRAVYPDGIDYPSADVTLRVNASDADISYTSNLSATFYVDGVNKGTTKITTNGDIDKNVGTQTGGTHEWYALVYDPWGGSVLTDTYTFGVPADLFIRDEENPDDLITGAEVQVSFFTENTSVTRSSSNGTISLYGLPTSDMLVSASADGYIARKTIIFSLYDTNSIYLLNESADVIYQKFVLNTQTITGSPTDYILKIQKPMNGTVDTVFSSYFDFDGVCGTYLIESDVYQLVIVAPDGTESTYGYLYPDPDGQIDIAYEGLSFNEYVNAWIATNTTINKETKNINYGYAETEQSNSLNPISVTEATMVVTDESGNSVYNVTVTDSSYVFQYSAAADGRYTVSVEILGEDEDGNAFSYTKSFVVDFIDDHFQFMPDAYPDWLKMLIITFLGLLILVAFGGYRSDLAVGLSFGLYAFSAYQEWISVSSLALGLMFIIVMAAFFKLQRKIKRSG